MKRVIYEYCFRWRNLLTRVVHLSDYGASLVQYELENEVLKYYLLVWLSPRGAVRSRCSSPEVGVNLCKQYLHIEKCATGRSDPKPKKCVGREFDGCSTMARKKSVQCLSKKLSKALLCHCCSHTLNLMINDVINLPESRNTVETIKYQAPCSTCTMERLFRKLR